MTDEPYYKPAYIKPPRHSNTRRAQWHNYRSPAIYMITLTKTPAAPPFGHLDPNSPQITLTTPGQILHNAIYGIHNRHPELSLLNLIVMPDHCHFIIRATSTLKKPIGAYIRSLKANVTHLINDHLQTSATQIFKPNFHDRILRGRNQLKAMMNYVTDNPRRLWIKAKHPNLFRRINQLIINNIPLLAFGNPFLLRNFNRQPVIIHRRYSNDEKKQKEIIWMDTARSGGVLVSPFISPEEKRIRDLAIEHGGNLIIINQGRVDERYKPSGRDFELCALGRLLMLFPWPNRHKNPGVSRAEALQMNRIAEIICQPNLTLSVSSNSQSTTRTQ